MDLGNFFIYSEQIEERGLDIGFNLDSAGHLVWLAAILAAALIASQL